MTTAPTPREKSKVLTGAELVAASLRREGLETFFFIMGAPMSVVEKACLDIGIRGIDVRHEQAAIMMAHAYARVSNRPAVCMGASGPGALNFGMALANAKVDCTPMLALGGASAIGDGGQGAFQEFDQVAAMQPLTKSASRIHEARRIPELINRALRCALSGKPGPVYLDLPADVIQTEVPEKDVVWPEDEAGFRPPRAAADPERLELALEWLLSAKRPLVLSGSGVFWSDAAAELQEWVEQSGIPLYTTPQGRGAVPEDHPFLFPSARSTALKEVDVALVVGTRLNYVFNHGRPPRFNANARLIRIELDPDELSNGAQVDLPILGDAKLVLAQLTAAAAGRIAPDLYQDWRNQLADSQLRNSARIDEQMSSADVPIHPLRLCKEVRDFIDRDAILVVDGQEILNYARQSIPTYRARHRLNSGAFGTMGVGLPFGLGAKAAKPGAQVVVLHGDGSFGMNGMELDTAVRHKLPVLVVVSLNGGWTADPDGKKPGRNLGYTRFHELAEALDCSGELVERPEDIRPALERAARAVAEGRPALVNVVTDWRARAGTVRFSRMNT